MFCNVARFSPNGDLLAATDESKVSLLKFQRQYVQLQDKEMQATLSHCFSLVGHSREVTDIQWSRDSRFLVSCSMD